MGRSPFPDTCIVELAYDDVGYIPTKRAFSDGGYEPTSSILKPRDGENFSARQSNFCTVLRSLYDG